MLSEPITYLSSYIISASVAFNQRSSIYKGITTKPIL